MQNQEDKSMAVTCYVLSCPNTGENNSLKGFSSAKTMIAGKAD